MSCGVMAGEYVASFEPLYGNFRRTKFAPGALPAFVARRPTPQEGRRRSQMAKRLGRAAHDGTGQEAYSTERANSSGMFTAWTKRW